MAAEKKAEFTIPQPVFNISIPENISIAGELEMNNETGEPVFNESLDDKDPSWNPDGGKIAFDSNKAGTRDVWILLLIKEA